MSTRRTSTTDRARPAPPNGTTTGASTRPDAEMRRVDVCIVGGGMVGATLAAALGGAGIDVALVDRTDTARMTDEAFDGRSSAIAFGSQQALAGIGVWAGMVDAAEPILDIRVSDGPSRLFLHYDHRTLEDGDPFGFIVENRAIRRALYTQLSGLETVTLVAPASVAGFEVGTGRTTIDLEDGRRISASLLVAADGTRSRLRRDAGIGVTRWDYPQDGIVCTMAHAAPHRGIAHERFLPAGPFAVLPMTDAPADAAADLAAGALFPGGHRSSIVWTERRAATADFLALDDDAFSAELGARFGPFYGEVRVAGPRWSYPLQLLHAERYVQPRFALIGDAAHTIHPIAGQGLNLGLRDVAALAEVLVDARRLGLDLGALDLLRQYERWRRFDNLALMGVTDAMNRLFSNDVAPVRLARDLGLAAVNKLPGLKKMFMRHAMGVVGNKVPRLIRGETL